MSNVKKLMMQAAGGGGLNVEDVFSTFLYTGNNSSNQIINNIDLSTEGGMVWTKRRDAAISHATYDTARGLSDPEALIPNTPDDAVTGSMSSFNTNGFTLNNNARSNAQDDEMCSWTFRKAPKFFDVVTYTGNYQNDRTVSHSLGSVPGFIIIKRYDAQAQWYCYHRSLDSTDPQGKYIQFNSTNGVRSSSTMFSNTAPTATDFTLGRFNDVNGNGFEFVAYLFAHNDGDGEFGSTGDKDIIKCGGYTGNGSSNGPEIDLGFEPQFLWVKRYDTDNGNWYMVDNIRNFGSGVNNAYLYANGSNAEFNDYELFRNQAQGFQPRQNFSVINGNNAKYLYIAIRRGPMATPENATDVFKVDKTASSSNPAYTSGFPVDMGLERRTVNGGNWSISSRLTHGRFLSTQNNDQESGDGEMDFDYMTGWQEQGYSLSDQVAWMWRRAPGYFDVVTYTGGGDATSTHTKNHNLGVPPEMLWIKCRSNNGTNWMVWHKDMNYNTGESYTNKAFMNLNNTNAATLTSNYWSYNANPQMTDSVFSVGSTYDEVNATNRTYVAYLFATLSGVSKVGGYTGNGGTSVTGNGQDIDCGFSNGARFVLITPTDVGDHWFLYDSERGIVAGNDATLLLNDNAGESTSSDEIDPLNSGFRVLNRNNQLNRTGRKYIFYAIA